MWGTEHMAMLAVAGALCLWLLYRRNWSWLGAVILSQLPFWAGAAVSWAVIPNDPHTINLATNLIAAGLFLEWANQRGHVARIWLAIVFLLAASLDIAHGLAGIPFYVIAQEILHYLALVIIGGRAYVGRFDNGSGNMGRSPGPKKRGGMV